MLVDGCSNLTVYLIRREQFETLRLGRVCPLPPRCINVSYPSLASAQLRFVPAPNGAACSSESNSGPRPFPFDAPFPTRPMTAPLQLAYYVPPAIPAKRKPVIKHYASSKDLPGQMIDMFG